MSSAEVLLMGDLRLRKHAAVVEDFTSSDFAQECHTLAATLQEFRLKNQFGRAISAPQIGIAKRLIALNLNGRRFFMVNPEITHRSVEMFTMWDDCMSFPHLYVRVARHDSISVTFQDEHGNHHSMNNQARAESELIQHEVDHLDGILAIDRAIDKDSIVYRSVFQNAREEFAALVDYIIES